MEFDAIPVVREVAFRTRSLLYWITFLGLALAWGPFLTAEAVCAYERESVREQNASSREVARAPRLITADDLAPLFRKELLRRAPWPDKDIHITRLQAHPARVLVPDGTLSFDVDPAPNSNYLGRVSFLFTIKVDGKVERRVRVGAWVEVYQPVLCATRPLRRGHVLQPEDLAVARQPLSRLKGRGLDSPEASLGLALKRSVRPGQVLTDNMLTPPVLLHRGARVTILATSPLLTVRAPGQVCENGVEGELVRVRNLMSQREIVAKVLDSRTVVVNF